MNSSIALRNLREVIELEEAGGDIPELYRWSQQPVLNPLICNAQNLWEDQVTYIFTVTWVCAQFIHCDYYTSYYKKQGRQSWQQKFSLCSTSIYCPIILYYFLFLKSIWNSFIIKLHTYRTASKHPHSSGLSMVQNTLLSIIWITKWWDQYLGKTEERQAMGSGFRM